MTRLYHYWMAFFIVFFEIPLAIVVFAAMLISEYGGKLLDKVEATQFKHDMEAM